MKRSGIYCVLCLADGKRYVGQTVDLDRRKKHHFRELSAGQHFNRHLQAAWRKYGEEEFEFRVLELAPKDMLDVRESSWIAFFRSADPEFGYNMTLGGHSGRRATPFTDEHRARLSVAGRGRVFSAEHRARLSAVNKGKKLSKEHLEKLRAANTGRTRSEEHKQRLAERNKVRIWTPEMRAKASASAKARFSDPKERAKISVSRKRLTAEEELRDG